MKKLRLLLAFCALLLGWSNASAQKDVTSQYITNATLSSFTENPLVITGWTNSNFNTPQRGNNTTGFASECYAGWSSVDISTYSLKQTITLPAGNYRLVNYSFYRYGANDGTHNNLDPEKSLCYLCAGSKKEKIKTLNSITDAASLANNQVEGANCFDSKMYRNVVEFTIASDNTEIEIGLEGTHEVTAGWIIAGMFELFDLDDLASVSSPTDVTYAIKNSGFEYRNLAGWTTTASSDNKAFWYMDNTALSGKAGIGWVESYQGGGIPNGRSIYQDLTGLDNGLYEVTVYGHLQQGSGSDGFYLYANSDKVAIGSTDKDYSVTTNVTDGNLTIKLASDGCNGNWAAFDKVRMKFYGDPLPAYQELLNGKVATAQALVDGNTIPDAAESALQTVINDNDNNPATFTTIDEFTTAISNIETAYNTYKALETPYAAWQTVKDLADDLAGLTYAETVSGSHTTFTDAISAQNTAAEASTTAGGLNTASAALKTAIKTYMSGATLTFVSELDFTCMIENPSFETGDFTGWTNTGMALQDNASFGKTGTYYAEKWEPADDTKYGVKQTISNLPAGSYIVSAHAKARSVESAKVYAGSEEAAVTIADSEKDYDVEFVSTGSDVEIGFEAEGNGTGSSWLCVDNFTLTYQGYAATSEEKTALAGAIADAEAKTLGFEAGEYAPYENVDALTKLATAKAIDPETASSSAVVAATTALTGATWTANVSDVDAICNGSFTGIARGTQDNEVPGWTETFRKLVTTDDYSALSASKEGRGMFSHNKTYVYGGQTGYTIPLKSKTKYTISFKAAGWENGDLPTVSAIVKKPNGDNLQTLSITPTKRINEDESLVSGSEDFVVETAGNHTIEVTVPSGTLAVITDFSIVRSGAVATIGSTGWTTFASSAPLDLSSMTASEGDVAAYYASATSAESVTVLPTESSAVKAGEGILLKGTAGATITIPVAASAGSKIDGNLMVGCPTATTITNETTNYGNCYVLGIESEKAVFQNVKNYIDGGNNVNIPAGKAYLNATASNGARSMRIVFGDITGVANVEAAAEAKAKDGKFIENGKLVIVKNGQKFNAAGQQVK